MNGEDLVKALPLQSILHYYIHARALIEPPVSYDLLCGAAVLSLALKRDVWVDQEMWKVYPAMSVMLVGPSGVGKNTAIGAAKEIAKLLEVPIIGGNTIEALVDQVQRCGNPASCLITAEELADMIGKKDYQQGLISGITDLLDTKDFKDISLKSSSRRIQAPTVGFMCGSTPLWLHSMLPKDSMGGGFYGRFLVAAEKEAKRFTSLTKRLPKADRDAAKEALGNFNTTAICVRDFCRGKGELEFSKAASDLYHNWYAVRHGQFSALANDYAHRSRDHAIRLALVSAVSCLRSTIEEEDVHFALTVVTHIAHNIDVVVAQASPEAELGEKILATLPTTHAEVLRTFSKGYAMRLIKDALMLLRESEQVFYSPSTGIISRHSKEKNGSTTK